MKVCVRKGRFFRHKDGIVRLGHVSLLDETDKIVYGGVSATAVDVEHSHVDTGGVDNIVKVRRWKLNY